MQQINCSIYVYLLWFSLLKINNCTLVINIKFWLSWIRIDNSSSRTVLVGCIIFLERVYDSKTSIQSILNTMHKMHTQQSFFISSNIWLYIYFRFSGRCNLPPVFTEDMNNLALSEATPVGFVVYTLEGYDPEGGEVTFGLIGSENFAVDPKSGEVKVIKALDREVCNIYIPFTCI